MRRFEVIVAPAAAQQARVISEWWRANRAAADPFDEELEFYGGSSPDVDGGISPPIDGGKFEVGCLPDTNP